MKPSRLALVVGSLGLATLLLGCGRNSAEAGHSGRAEHGEEGGVPATFKEGRGLQFTPEVVAALGVRTAEAEERLLARPLGLTAQVFSTGPVPRALAMVSSAQADGLKPGLKTAEGAELVAISRTAEKASGQVELIFTLPSGLPTAGLGDTVALRLAVAADSSALTVPRSALLEAASGALFSANLLQSPVFVISTVPSSGPLGASR